MITVYLAFAAAAVPRAASAQDPGLQQRVNALEAQVQALSEQVTALTRSRLVEVNCAAGERIQPALTSAQRHPASVVISVYGVCTENIVISRSDLLIRAGAPGAGIIAAHPGNVVSVAPNPIPKAFMLSGLTISGGGTGVSVEHGSSARLVDCTIRNNGLGIRADHGSSVRLENTIVEANTGGGVAIQDGAYLFVTGGEVGQNIGNGISLGNGSVATVDGGARIASNGGWGVLVSARSLLSLGATTVTANGLTGVFVSGGSSVNLNAGATITANVLSGMSLMDTSLVQKHRALADIHITHNGGYGIVCSLPPAVAQVVGFTFETGNVSGNASGNIDCPVSPGPKAQ